jgi:hypothetical protein
VDAHTFIKQAKKDSTNAVSKKVDGSCFPGPERSANGEIHATRAHNNVISELQNGKIKLRRASQ